MDADGESCMSVEPTQSGPPTPPESVTTIPSATTPTARDAVQPSQEKSAPSRRVVTTARNLFNRARGRDEVASERAPQGKNGGQTRPRRRLAWRSWAIFLGLLAFNYIVVARIVPDQPDRLEIP